MALIEQLTDKLAKREPLPPLYPHEPWQPELSRQIADAGDEELFGGAVENEEMANACRAGLLLWNDDLHASHTVAQGIETQTGSFWHAIMHRRENDPGNAHHWWRHTGRHPAFPAIHERVVAELEGADGEGLEFREALQRAKEWQPMLLVAYGEASKRSGDDEWLRRVQAIEMETLLSWCQERLNQS